MQEMNGENFIPLIEASLRIKLPIRDLFQLIGIGKIKSVTMHEQILVREIDVMTHQPRSNFADLEGHPLGIGEAARKYGLKQQTVSRWIQKGLIKILSKQGQKVFIDEADIAYQAAIYNEHPGQGRRTDLLKS